MILIDINLILLLEYTPLLKTHLFPLINYVRNIILFQQQIYLGGKPYGNE
jgi:hypothetical protein